VTKADVEAAFGGSSSAGKIDENGHFNRDTLKADAITLAKTILARL
jgi:hypothetical protein